MKVERARQIFDSSDVIPVHLEGRPVWIEALDVPSATATVQLEVNSGEIEKVAIDRLEEGRIS